MPYGTEQATGLLSEGFKMASGHFHFRLKSADASGARDRFLYVSRQGKYENRHDLVTLESGNLPTWATSGEDFWSAVEQNETGNAADSFILSVPRGLSRAAVERLRQRFGQTIGANRPYTLAEHNDLAEDREENRHFHALVSTRTIDGIDRDEDQFFRRFNWMSPGKGGARKATRKGPVAEREQAVRQIRRQWAAELNLELEAAGLPLIDPRRLKDQGIDHPAKKRRKMNRPAREGTASRAARNAASAARLAAKRSEAVADATLAIRATPSRPRPQPDTQNVAKLKDKIRRKNAVSRARQAKIQVAQPYRGTVDQAKDMAQKQFQARQMQPGALARSIRRYAGATEEAAKITIAIPDTWDDPALPRAFWHTMGRNYRADNGEVHAEVSVKRLADFLSFGSAPVAPALDVFRALRTRTREPAHDKQAVRAAQTGRREVQQSQDQIDRMAATGRADGWQMGC